MVVSNGNTITAYDNVDELARYLGVDRSNLRRKIRTARANDDSNFEYRGYVIMLNGITLEEVNNKCQLLQQEIQEIYQHIGCLEDTLENYNGIQKDVQKKLERLTSALMRGLTTILVLRIIQLMIR